MPSLILGCRGSGKTQHLIDRVIKEVDDNPHRPLLFVTGKRQENVSKIKSRLGLLNSGFSIEIHTLFSLRRFLLASFWPTFLDKSPHVLSHATTVTLVQEYLKVHPEFFNGAQLDTLLYRHLLGRARLRSAHGWDWPEFDKRTAHLEPHGLSIECNAFIRGYQTVFKKKNLFDFGLLIDTLSEHAEKWKPVFKDTLWLVDDYQELTFSDQNLIESLSTDLICTANPEASITHHLGAFPERISELQTKWNTHCLVDKQENLLGDKIFKAMMFDNPELPLYSSPVQTASNYGNMLNSIVNDVKKKLSSGVQPKDIVLVTWHLNESITMQLESRFQQAHIPLEIFRGSLKIQRYPGVNTLVALCRLILWNELKKDPLIPPLTGYEMSQILMCCGEVPANKAAELRFQFKDQLNQWGHFLKNEALTNPAIKNLQNWLQILREDRETYPSLLEIALTCWNQLVMPSPWVQNDLVNSSVKTFFYRLSEFIQLQELWPDLNMDLLFIKQILTEDIFEFPNQSEALDSQSVKLMTLHRLCEFGHESLYQLWFDLKSPFWEKDVHPLNNPQILSREWPIDRLWELEDSEDYRDKKLATMVKQGLAMGQKHNFYASHADMMGKRQNFERLIHLISS